MVHQYAGRLGLLLVLTVPVILYLMVGFGAFGLTGAWWLIIMPVLLIGVPLFFGIVILSLAEYAIRGLARWPVFLPLLEAFSRWSYRWTILPAVWLIGFAALWGIEPSVSPWHCDTIWRLDPAWPPKGCPS